MKLLTLKPRGSALARAKVFVGWNPHDLWFGVYWKRTALILNVWICIVPALPLHVQVFLGKLRRAR